MGLYLNSDRSLKNYEELYRSDYFVDKSLIIERLNKIIGKRSKYLGITRPRRFGKTSVADMVAAYYSKTVDSKDIFDNLNISKVNSYEENLNKYNVINISFNKMPDSGKTYDNYINMIKQSLISDIVKYYPNINPNEFFTVGDMLESTGDQFIFVLDEWDYIFSKDLFQENQDDFLEFLTFLLKDKPYVLLCYMTGVLPIKRYSSGSALNMFDEFTFLKDRRFGEFFGFTTDEVLKLCDENQYMNFEKLELWYNGYTTANGVKIYNPRSVIKALRDKSFGYVSEIIENSRTMLKATVNKDTETVEKILHDIHNSEIPILQYNDENSLSCVVTLAYLSARDTYRVEREEKTGKGYADFTFHPRRKNDTAFIVELKKDEVPEVAIKQIKEKEYIQKFKVENEGKEVLAVAICYDSKSKEHHCKIETI